ncbi:MAG: GtrA family protein [Actinomycetota bacterium]
MTEVLDRSEARSRRFKQVIAFAAVSVATTVLDFALFNLLVFGDLFSPVVANTISYGSGIVASYLLNKRLTFSGGGRDKRSHEFGLFVVINLLGLGLNNASVLLATRVAQEAAFALNAAKLIGGAVTWIFKFVAFKRWVYPMDRTAVTEGTTPNA